MIKTFSYKFYIKSLFTIMNAKIIKICTNTDFSLGKQSLGPKKKKQAAVYAYIIFNITLKIICRKKQKK